VTLQVMQGRWDGLGTGHGRLRRRTVTITARGRGAAARPREITLWMPGLTTPPPIDPAPTAASAPGGAAPSPSARAPSSPRAGAVVSSRAGAAFSSRAGAAASPRAGAPSSPPVGNAAFPLAGTSSSASSPVPHYPSAASSRVALSTVVSSARALSAGGPIAGHTEAAGRSGCSCGVTASMGAAARHRCRGDRDRRRRVCLSAVG
jgi:hypothetical protein